MTGVDSKSIALFFFYAYLDEQRAIEATTKTLQDLRARMAKHPEIKPAVGFVQSTYQVWHKNSGRFLKGRQNFSPSAGWVLPENFDLGPWKEFQKTSQEDEFLALIWSQILMISDEDVALGLGISIGTLRYRVGKALRKLGALAQPVSTRPPPGRYLGIVSE